MRDAIFAIAARFGIRVDPLPVPTVDESATELAAMGDPYQLYRAMHAKSDIDWDRLRSIVRLLTIDDPFDVRIDARGKALPQVIETIRSLSAQLYVHWRAYVIGADAPDDAGGDERIRWNWEARELPAAGTFITEIEAGDQLEPDALLSIASSFAVERAEIVYTDSDQLIDGVPSNPSFKPDWSPETLLTRNYIARLCVFRESAIARLHDMDWSLGAAAWFDALLRSTDTPTTVFHVPQVLIHTTGERATRSEEQRIAIVRAALVRRGEEANLALHPCGIDVRFCRTGSERVTIVIPTRDRADLLGGCLSSIFEHTVDVHFDVIVVDNGSTELATRELLDAWRHREPERLRVIVDDGPFNYSRLNNTAVRHSSGTFIVLLNNDTEVITPDWLAAMLGQARRSQIGAVGALLLYPDQTVQHGGVLLGGVLGLAGHAYRHTSPETAQATPALQLDTNYVAVTGACLMVERSKFDQVGGLDEALAVAYNDVDLCAKLKAAGYRNVLVPRARLVHHESKTRGLDDTAEKLARGLQESEAFRRRWPEWSARDPYYNPNLTLNAEDFSLRL